MPLEYKIVILERTLNKVIKCSSLIQEGEKVTEPQLSVSTFLLRYLTQNRKLLTPRNLATIDMSLGCNGQSVSLSLGKNSFEATTDLVVGEESYRVLKVAEDICVFSTSQDGALETKLINPTIIGAELVSTRYIQSDNRYKSISVKGDSEKCTYKIQIDNNRCDFIVVAKMKEVES